MKKACAGMEAFRELERLTRVMRVMKTGLEDLAVRIGRTSDHEETELDAVEVFYAAERIPCGSGWDDSRYGG